MKLARRAVSIATFVSAGLVVLPAVAQAPTPPAGGQPSGGQADPRLEEARQRYERGLQLFNEANYEAARVEFERAYQLAPSYKILYNIGLSYEQLGDYVQAQTTLQRYLEQGGKDISEERRSEVAKELAQIRPRIAHVMVRTNVDASEILIDDACGTDAASENVNCGAVVGRSREILVNPGRRRITLRKEGFLPETQSITVAGSDKLEIQVNLRELPKGYVEKKTNPFLLPMWIGWGITGAGAVTTTVFAILAKNAEKKQNRDREEFGSTRQQLDDDKNKTNTLATVTDVALIGSIVAAGASTYFTIRALSWHGEPSPVNVQVGLGSVALDGHF